MNTEDIKKFINNDKFYINKYEKYNEINIDYIDTGKWKIEDYNDVYTTPITWTTSGDKYYYEKYSSSPFESPSIVSVDLADDSKKEKSKCFKVDLDFFEE